jgi:hypothetical protein
MHILKSKIKRVDGLGMVCKQRKKMNLVKKHKNFKILYSF